MTTTNHNTLKAIEDLQQYCEQMDGISLKLNWESLRQDTADGGAEVLVHYEDGELAGFMGLYAFGSEMEICGMVHPDHRRRGIFSKLWNEAHEIIQRKEIKSLLLNTPAASASGTAFLATLPLAFNHAEYQMKWDGKTRPGDGLQSPSKGGSVHLRPARADEAHLLTKLDADGFGMTLEEAAEMNAQGQRDNHEKMIIIESDEEAVGKMRLHTEHGETWIYGFVVAPSQRGRGIGRSALLQTIDQERQHGNGIHLEVALDNPNALKLYESCGFTVLNKQDYYRFIG